MLLLFWLAACAQLFSWYKFHQLAFPVEEPELPPGSSAFAPVSVIICFHNEEGMLADCLTAALQQRYPGEFEVVAVDDHSTDGSAAIAQRLAAAHAGQLRLVQPGPTRPGKKDALTFGIQQARFAHLLLTDADCQPASDEWLLRMTAPLRAGAEVVLGVSPYQLGQGRWVDHFQHYEAYYVALKYLTFARAQQPYMGVGRNLAYHKHFFLRAGGFAAHADLPGGDDDLLVGHHALPENTVCVTHPAARTYSQPSGSWSVFLRQRRRHQSVGFRYRPFHQLLLGGLALSHGLFFLLGFFLLFSSRWWLGLLLYGLRFLFVYGAFQRASFGGEAAGAREGVQQQSQSPWQVVLADAMLGPFYFYLAVVGLLPARGW
ncbi:MAG: glycosyltransferase [Bacteroidota bacterium]